MGTVRLAPMVWELVGNPALIPVLPREGDAGDEVGIEAGVDGYSESTFSITSPLSCLLEGVLSNSSVSFS